jgi:hypothetical protein
MSYDAQPSWLEMGDLILASGFSFRRPSDRAFGRNFYRLWRRMSIPIPAQHCFSIEKAPPQGLRRGFVLLSMTLGAE